MKKISSLSVLACLILSLIGCNISLTTYTKINDDGSGFRITTYSTDGKSDKDELLAKYEFPKGGQWKEEERKTQQYNYTDYTYEVKRAFKDLNKLDPDYIRKGAKPGNISGNTISFKINRGPIFTTYEYEEVFRDCSNEKQAKDFCQRQYDYFIDMVSKDIEEALPKLVNKEKIKILLDERYRSFFDYFLTEYLKDPDFFVNNEEYSKRNEEFEQKNSEENFTSFIADYVLAKNKGADKKEVTLRLKEAYKKISEESQLQMDILNEKNYNDMLGAYGIPILVSYSFRTAVVMPGKIIDSNAHEVNAGLAKWNFEREDFFLKDYKLRVKSRKLNSAGITILVMALLAALIILKVKVFKKRQK